MKPTRWPLRFSSIDAVDVSLTNSNAVISWPVAPTGFQLQSATSLNPPVSWTSVTNAVTIANNQNVVIVARRQWQPILPFDQVLRFNVTSGQGPPIFRREILPKSAKLLVFFTCSKSAETDSWRARRNETPPRNPCTTCRASAITANCAIDKVGVRGLRFPIQVRDKAHSVQNTVATIGMFVDLPKEFKGTHMSRFIEVLNAHGSVIHVENIGEILHAHAEEISCGHVASGNRVPLFHGQKVAGVAPGKPDGLSGAVRRGGVRAGN